DARVPSGFELGLGRDRARVGARLPLRHRAAWPRANADGRRGGRGVRRPITTSQTVGPFFSHALPWTDGAYVVPDGPGGAIWLRGTVTDGAGQPVPDGLVETWQADPDGRFDHPDDPRGAAAGCRGVARCA